MMNVKNAVMMNDNEMDMVVGGVLHYYESYNKAQGVHNYVVADKALTNQQVLFVRSIVNNDAMDQSAKTAALQAKIPGIDGLACSYNTMSHYVFVKYSEVRSKRDGSVFHNVGSLLA